MELNNWQQQKLSRFKSNWSQLKLLWPQVEHFLGLDQNWNPHNQLSLSLGYTSLHRVPLCRVPPLHPLHTSRSTTEFPVPSLASLSVCLSLISAALRHLHFSMQETKISWLHIPCKSRLKGGSTLAVQLFVIYMFKLSF